MATLHQIVQLVDQRCAVVAMARQRVVGAKAAVECRQLFESGSFPLAGCFLQLFCQMPEVIPQGALLFDELLLFHFPRASQWAYPRTVCTAAGPCSLLMISASSSTRPGAREVL